MRPERGRAKKLIVAFHFQFANQAGWKCDDCRRNGLEKRRNCGWLGGRAAAPRRPVWIRKHAVAEECPVSYITPQSMAWLEEFTVRKLVGGRRLEALPAKTVDALCVLENEYRREVADGEE